jgi:zinc transport system substrate-binding protein
MFKKWVAVFLCLAITFSFAVSYGEAVQANEPSGEPEASGGQGTAAETADASEQSTISVYVTFDAMREFVAAVGKEHVAITTIIPTGTEPHDFEPKAQDLVGLSTARVFVYNGLGMEAWVEDAISAVGNASLIVVEASSGADAIVNTDAEEINEHGQYDPHLWLSLKGAELEAANIKNGLIQADPANEADYERNCEEFTSQLESLFTRYDQLFQTVSKKDFVTGHAAFGYLCRDFGLEQNSVEDTFAEGEPTAKQLAELIEYCKANGVTTIFAEEMASPQVSQTLADEVGATVETIYTVESAEDDMTYLERMEYNLAKIDESLTK